MLTSIGSQTGDVPTSFSNVWSHKFILILQFSIRATRSSFACPDRHASDSATELAAYLRAWQDRCSKPIEGFQAFELLVCSVPSRKTQGRGATRDGSSVDATQAGCLHKGRGPRGRWRECRQSYGRRWCAGMLSFWCCSQMPWPIGTASQPNTEA